MFHNHISQILTGRNWRQCSIIQIEGKYTSAALVNTED